jgi:DNA replication protein DnaC
MWLPFTGRWGRRDICNDCVTRINSEKVTWQHEAQTRAKEQRRLACVPEPKRGMTAETFTPETPSQQEALQAVLSGGSLWLWGPPGVGKTHLAAAACLATDDSRLCLVADLMADLRAAARDGDDEEIVQRFRTYNLLALDDLGVDRPTTYATEQLYRIVDTRYDSNLRTIVTSNAEPSVVAATIGARLHSRLVGMCRVIHVEGKDGRLA